MLPRGVAHNMTVDDEMRQECLAIVEQYPEYTLQQINRGLCFLFTATWKTRSEVCTNAVSKILRGELIILKKMKIIEQERNPDGVKMARQFYADWLMNMDDYEDVPELNFVGESGFNLWLSRGRVPQGRRVVRKGPNFFFIVAIFTRTWLLQLWLFWRRNKSSKIQHLHGANNSSSWKWQKKHYIFDDASCHHRICQVSVLADHKFQFLPAYSPFLNIAESAFFNWKQLLKNSWRKP